MSIAATRLLVYGGLLAAAAGTAFVVFDGPKVKRGSRVFLLGDSLSVGLSRPLAQLAKEHGVEFAHMGKVGTRIDQWANNAALFDAIRKFKPTLILVSLGTNDEFMKLDGGKRQAPYLETLLTKLRAIAPVAWIGPPKLPKPDTNGVIPLILKKVPSSHYFPSQKLTIPRAGDKLHPTTSGYAGWAGAIWKWLS